MLCLLKLLFFIESIGLSLYLVEAVVFSCNTTAPCGCSRYNVDINSRIVGGEPAVRHSWGWAVSLRVTNELHFCGGAVLSPYYILTAAHCVDDPEISDFELKAAVGTDTLSDNNGQRLPVAKIFVHPHWISRTHENDIAIIKLEKPILFNDSNIAKICLPSINELAPTEFPMAKSRLVAIGWGYTTMDGTESDVLRQVTLEGVENQEEKCNNSINNVTLQFCAAVDGGGKDTCEGDSGGPLMYYSEVYGQWMVAGITSYGRGCALSINAGIYTRISMYFDWIKAIVGQDGIVIAGENSTVIVAENSTVTAGKNHANVGFISHILFIIVLSFLIFIRWYK